jgi:hypothetical protein
MKSSPIVTATLWYDRDVMGPDMPLVGLTDGTMQWFFRRESAHGRGPYVSAVVSGADDTLRLENDEVIALADADARRALPGTRGRP